MSKLSHLINAVGTTVSMLYTFKVIAMVTKHSACNWHTTAASDNAYSLSSLISCSEGKELLNSTCIG